VEPGTEAAAPLLPPDIETMRESARILLAEDAEPLVLDELDTLTLALRGRIDLLIPEVTLAAAREPKDSIPRYCALACVGEARGKLRAGQGAEADSGVAYARKLARSLNALCDHWENLSQYQGAGQ
jgi:hypothetical protein